MPWSTMPYHKLEEPRETGLKSLAGLDAAMMWHVSWSIIKQKLSLLQLRLKESDSKNDLRILIEGAGPRLSTGPPSASAELSVPLSSKNS